MLANSCNNWMNLSIVEYIYDIKIFIGKRLFPILKSGLNGLADTRGVYQVKVWSDQWLCGDTWCVH